MKIGSFPTTSLAEARVKLAELKTIRQEARCPATEQKAPKQEVRRMLYVDVVADPIWSVIDRGANVQADSILRELTAAFVFCDWSWGVG